VLELQPQGIDQLAQALAILAEQVIGQWHYQHPRHQHVDFRFHILRNSGRSMRPSSQ